MRLKFIMKHRFIRFLLFLYVFSFVFDFKKDDSGGDWVQYLFAALSLISSLFLSLSIEWSRVPRRLIRIIFFWFAFLLVGVLSAVLHGVSWEFLLRVFLPFLLCGMSMLAVASCITVGFPVVSFFRIIFWAAVVSMAWSAFYALVFDGYYLDDVRYRILSPVIVYLIVHGVVFVYASPGYSIGPFVICGATAVLSILSETRSLLIVNALTSVLCILLILYSRWFSRVGGWIRSGFFVKYVGMYALGMIVALSLVLIRPDIFSSFAHRILGYQEARSQVDPTYLTRVAESSGMMEMMQQNPMTFIWGYGFGQSYHWSLDYAEELAPYVGNFSNKVQWEAGHVTPVYLFFATGFLGVILCFFIALYILSEMYFVFSRYRRDVLLFLDVNFMVVAIAVFGFCVAALTGNIFGSRLSGLYFGLLLGAICWKRSSWENVLVARDVSAINKKRTTR